MGTNISQQAAQKKALSVSQSSECPRPQGAGPVEKLCRTQNNQGGLSRKHQPAKISCKFQNDHKFAGSPHRPQCEGDKLRPFVSRKTPQNRKHQQTQPRQRNRTFNTSCFPYLRHNSLALSDNFAHPEAKHTKKLACMPDGLQLGHFDTKTTLEITEGGQI